MYHLHTGIFCLKGYPRIICHTTIGNSNVIALDIRFKEWFKNARYIYIYIIPTWFGCVCVTLTYM